MILINNLRKKYNGNLIFENVNLIFKDKGFYSIFGKSGCGKSTILNCLSSLDNDYYNDKGKCYALKNQIGILVDGTIIPCCLDTLGIIKLGNIFVDNINDIINTSKYQNMLNGFKNNKKVEELCKHCSFIK